MRTFLRKVARVLREIVLFPFRLVWWILRGSGHVLKAIGEFIGEVVDAGFESLGK